MDLSRREFMAIALGGVGAVTACACGGAGIAAWLLLNREADGAAVPTTVAEAQPTAVPMPQMVARDVWGALPPDHTAENESGFYSDDNPLGWRVYDGDLRDIYKTLVIHHSVIDEPDGDLATLSEIQTLHREDRQWADVAYHFFVGKDGTLYEGRDIAVRGAHVAGANTGSLGICLLGNFMIDAPTAEQMTALIGLSRWVVQRLQLTHVAGHRDFNDFTVCPGDNLVSKLPDFATNVGLAYGTDGYVEPGTSYLPCTCCCHT